MKAVVLAAGEGTRLRPFTKVLPKPLLPVGEKPMLDIILRQLAHYGFTEIIVTACWLRESVRLFLQTMQQELPDVQLTYVGQDKLMGTAGGISSLPGLQGEAFLVMNADVLTTMNYGDLMRYHREKQAALTIGMYEKKVKISLGVLQADADHHLLGWAEKPETVHSVSMGIYVVDPSLLTYIPPDDYMDMPTLARQLISEGKPVRVYPFHGHWIDIGRPEDFTEAQEQFERLKDEFLPKG
ncbi:MAG: NTP transferase domain-containing protein [Chloroflexi bacterium]|nr:NTP transferase domain-containing protein [Chloroflexota bacterium]